MSMEAFAAQVGTDMKALRQSTGLRNITSSIGSSHLAPDQTGRLLVSRTGPVVNLVFDMLAFTGDAWVSLGSLPAGLRPITQQPVAVFWGVNEATFSETSMLVIRSTGALSFRPRPTGLARTAVTYITTDSFPTTLPGTPA